jgi:catechol 2,3-dioxygenase-like lactoylglutathione lyase family enzyme
MSDSVPPRVDCEVVHPGLPVGDDVPAAVDYYTSRLGFSFGFSWGEPPVVAGVNLGHVQVFLNRRATIPDGGSAYFVVGDADELYTFHQVGGVEIEEAIDDRPWGLRDYVIRDPYGNRLAFGHYIPVPGERTRIERVDVHVRLEKRLAALLSDLAEHKRMSVSSTLEEILLHTNEPLGDGVASPHTKATLRYIQELKRKHGIEYGSHASYGWVEEGEEGGETAGDR